MRIAMLGLKGIPASYGGIENHVENIATRIAKLGYDVTVFCRKNYTQIRGTYKGVNLEVLPSISSKRLNTITHSLLSTIKAIAGRFDILHYHNMASHVFSSIPDFLSKKTVCTVHSLSWREKQWGAVGKSFLKVGEMVAVRYPSQTIAVSRLIKEYLQNKYLRDVCYIPNGVVFKEPLPLNKLRRFGLEPKRYILTVGRIIPDRGIDYLIEAYKRLNCDIKLVIVGDVEFDANYFKKLKSLVDKNIVFTGYLFGDELTEAYSNCLFYVHPSKVEGLSISILEAMSFGKCVLCSDIPENLQIIYPDDNGAEPIGLHFKCSDVNSLVEKLHRAIEDHNLIHHKGRICREYVRVCYDWDKITRDIVGVYEKVLNN